MTGSGAELQPLSVASGRVAAELRGLQDRIARLEDTLESLYQNPAVKLDGHSIGTLQDVDFLLQSITALSNYLERLSMLTTVDGQVCVKDAISAITLRDMAARLRGAEVKREQTQHAELF
ncbi:hypothetical protein [Tropicibacter oceani]|uniref:Uncharacterized protein n=1 Tax=Tropicibacter oceani TaxID=3058420 RepID=A0ABY8QID5_9RHOB|nr:hypothetical protein [Tropicibacter oceani]WGW03743.1 hypothetical protein QF118_17775 [Tropicibacter oceani]